MNMVYSEPEEGHDWILYGNRDIYENLSLE
jgi:hypothetical protein